MDVTNVPSVRENQRKSVLNGDIFEFTRVDALRKFQVCFRQDL